MTIPVLLLALACSDYDLSASKDLGTPLGGDDTGVSLDDPGPSTTGTPPGGPGTGTDPVEPGEGEPPPTTLEGACEEGAPATMSPEEIYVLSWDPVRADGTLEASEAGWYDIYDLSIAESGAAQTNETSYVRVPNATNPGGLPAWDNCDGDWIVPDADNAGDPGTTRFYLGTFWLEAGANTIELHHACPRIRDGECTSFHVPDPPDTDCWSGSANSVHLRGEGLCVIPRPPG